MSKINIVIADVDNSYVNGVEKYMNENQYDKFFVTTFTNKEKLLEYVEIAKSKIDVLLVCTELFEYSLTNKGITILAILSSGRLPREYKSCEIVNKYQLADSLANNIIHLFTEKNKDIIVSTGKKNTRVIGVYSPIGGVGKSTICYGGAFLCAQRNLKTFYLNLENAPSTNLFFDCNGEYNISHVFYYLKAKNKNLHLKIQGIRQIDMYSNIHYFNPPESVLEIYDNTNEEYAMLINGMRNIDEYDVIFVDLSSDIERCNIKVLDCCDEILLVTCPDYFSNIKIDSFIRELEILSEREKINIIKKIRLVINKLTNSDLSFDSSFKPLNKQKIKIPYIASLYSIQNQRLYMDVNNLFKDGYSAFLNTLT